MIVVANLLARVDKDSNEAAGGALPPSAKGTADLLGHEIEVFAARKRSIGEGLLLPVSTRQHVISNEIKQPTYLEIGSLKAVDERRCERTVAVVAIQRCLTMFGGIDDERTCVRFDRRQPTGNRTRGNRPPHLIQERIVSARVQNNKPEVPGALDHTHDLADVDRFKVYVSIDEQAGINRDKIVCPTVFDSMAGIIDHGPICAVGNPGELTQRRHDLVPFQVGLQRDRLKSRIPQGGGKCCGVILRIWQRGHVFVSAVSDEKGNAPAEGRRRRNRRRQRRRDLSGLRSSGHFREVNADDAFTGDVTITGWGATADKVCGRVCIPPGSSNCGLLCLPGQTVNKLRQVTLPTVNNRLASKPAAFTAALRTT